MEKNEVQFIIGFNSGYILAEHEPKLLISLLNGLYPISSYITGMSFGQKEYELAVAKIKLVELKEIRKQQKGSRTLEEF